MQNIVKVENDELVVTIDDIAKFSGNELKSVKDLIRNKRADLEEFGLLGTFKDSDLRWHSLKLSEPQATLIIISLKANAKVDKFRKELVRQFYQMKNQVCQTNQKALEQKETQLLTAQNIIQDLKVKRMKTYKDGFVSLRKYLKDNSIKMSEETAWSKLLNKNIVSRRDVVISKVFLEDKNYGRQDGKGLVEFNSRALDSIFEEFIGVQPDLMDFIDYSDDEEDFCDE